MRTERQQRYTGRFYTPLPFAGKALQFIESVLARDELQSGKYRLWDMAAGTGNLELTLPPEVLPYCYLSTIDSGEVKELQKEFPQSTVFLYDYLNDDAARVFVTEKTPADSVLQWKMPAQLRKDLDDPEIQWLILVNPPYVTAQDAAMKGKTKNNVADTAVRQKMHAEKLGEVSRELYTQFLYRILAEFQNRKAHLGLFAPLKYLLSCNYQRFRDNVFHCRFQTGFVFSSSHFGGTSTANHFPVSFALWDLRDKQTMDAQKIVLDVLDGKAEKIGEKPLRIADRSQFLSRWIKRPPATIVFPPLGSALTVKGQNKDTRNRIAEGFLASLMCPGNELQCQSKTVLLSGPQASAGAISVTAENFEQAMVVFAARRIPQDTWLTHVDQFGQPNRELPPQFINDCVLWTLFDDKNQTAALRNVSYQGNIYQIKNHFFPFLMSELRHWDIADSAIRATLENAEDSFVARYLRQRTLSPFLQQMLSVAETVYRRYFRVLNRLPLQQYKIETADAGWRQIVSALSATELGKKECSDLKELHRCLKAAILPQLQDYGIVGSAGCVNF